VKNKNQAKALKIEGISGNELHIKKKEKRITDFKSDGLK